MCALSADTQGGGASAVAQQSDNFTSLAGEREYPSEENNWLLDAAELKNCRSKFKLIDLNGDGFIDHADLRAFAITLGMNPDSANTTYELTHDVASCRVCCCALVVRPLVCPCATE